MKMHFKNSAFYILKLQPVIIAIAINMIVLISFITCTTE